MIGGSHAIINLLVFSRPALTNPFSSLLSRTQCFVEQLLFDILLLFRPLSVAPLEMRLVGRTAVQNHAVRSAIRHRYNCVQNSGRVISFSTSTSVSSRPSLPRVRPSPNPLAKEIAILGGGITGLSTAHNITRCIPNAKVTIYEASDRLGGWLNSELVQVDDGEVLFEWGPRTLRPDLGGSGVATLDLVRTRSNRWQCLG